jgi:hypothetical protein
MTTAKDVLSKAKRRESTLRLYLDGPAEAEFRTLDAELTRRTTAEDWETDDPFTEAADLADRITAAAATMEESAVLFRFRSLGRLEWEALLDAHPGRSETERFNFTTFPVALVAASLADPEMTVAEVEELFDLLNEGQRDEMFGAAFNVNQEATSVPFSAGVSVVNRWRERRSKQPEPGESPEASS